MVQIEWKDQRPWHITGKKKTQRKRSRIISALELNLWRWMPMKTSVWKIFLSISRRLEAEGFDVLVRIIKQCFIPAEFRKYCSRASCWWKAYTVCPISLTYFKVILSKCFLNSVAFLISLPCQRKIRDENAAFSGQAMCRTLQAV